MRQVDKLKRLFKNNILRAFLNGLLKLLIHYVISLKLVRFKLLYMLNLFFLHNKMFRVYSNFIFERYCSNILHWFTLFLGQV